MNFYDTTSPTPQKGRKKPPHYWYTRLYTDGHFLRCVSCLVIYILSMQCWYHRMSAASTSGPRNDRGWTMIRSSNTGQCGEYIYGKHMANLSKYEIRLNTCILYIYTQTYLVRISPRRSSQTIKQQ